MTPPFRRGPLNLTPVTHHNKPPSTHHQPTHHPTFYHRYTHSTPSHNNSIPKFVRAIAHGEEYDIPLRAVVTIENGRVTIHYSYTPLKNRRPSFDFASQNQNHCPASLTQKIIRPIDSPLETDATSLLTPFSKHSKPKSSPRSVMLWSEAHVDADVQQHNAEDDNTGADADVNSVATNESTNDGEQFCAKVTDDARTLPPLNDTNQKVDNDCVDADHTVISTQTELSLTDINKLEESAQLLRYQLSLSQYQLSKSKEHNSKQIAENLRLTQLAQHQNLTIKNTLLKFEPFLKSKLRELDNKALRPSNLPPLYLPSFPGEFVEAFLNEFPLTPLNLPN